MNDSNLIQPNKAPGLFRPSPAASSSLRDWRGDGAGPPGAAAGAGDIASAGDSSSQDDLVPHPARTPDGDVAVSYASARSSSPSKRDPPTAAAFPKRNLCTSQLASFSAMDANPASLTAASASAFSGEQSPRRGLSDPATSAMRTAIDRPVSQPLSPERQSNGSAPRLASSPSKTATASRLELVQGQKRTATGEIKAAVPGTMSQVPATTNGAIHARKMSADSRIAELSAQLRARLSYAAAKVEKSWQARQGDGDRRLYNGSPEGKTVSAPDSFRHDHSRASNPVTSTASSSSWHRTQSSRSSLPSPQTTPFHMQQALKLAPPADIVASGGSGTRRRPNPDATNATDYNPYPRHRRHFSEHEARASRSNTTTIPETPPSSLPASTPNAMGNRPTIKHRTPSQNALMEQDAIETLLFMSSPENSGYHPSSQSRQSNISMSIEAQMGSTQSSQSSIGSNGSHGMPTQKAGFAGGQRIGPEAQAGDEIDRMLNQMRGASEAGGETRLSSYDFSIDSWKH